MSSVTHSTDIGRDARKSSSSAKNATEKKIMSESVKRLSVNGSK